MPRHGAGSIGELIRFGCSSAGAFATQCSAREEFETSADHWPSPRAFQVAQFTPVRLRKSVATGRRVCLSCAAMHRSDSAIFRFKSAISCDVRPRPAISPDVNRAVSNAFNASRFFLSWTLCHAIWLLLSALMKPIPDSRPVYDGTEAEWWQGTSCMAGDCGWEATAFSPFCRKTSFSSLPRESVGRVAVAKRRSGGGAYVTEKFHNRSVF